MGNQIAVVVSAMAGTTDNLVNLATNVGKFHDAREYDNIVAADIDHGWFIVDSVTRCWSGR